MHFNHDDIVEQFLSPLTNDRTDEYGGTLENRMRFALRILEAVRGELGADRCIGLRLNAFEELDGGYDPEDGRKIAKAFSDTGLIDYLSVVVGSHWGNPSYIQQQQFAPGEWAALAGEIRKVVAVPVVYTGLVDHPDLAERIIADGNADVVGIARAHVADGQLLAKARKGETELIRPCIAGNDCINRRYVDGLPFGCAVNPMTAKEVDGPFPRASRPRDILVVGGGPAGMELAALTAESGHRVRLWEAGDELGGQLLCAVQAPNYDRMARYLDWQKARLERAGVTVETGRRATAEDVLAATADTVAIATGALPRRPPVPGSETALEGRDVLSGTAKPGNRVLVIAEEDHLQPLAIADFLSTRGHNVTLAYATATPAILLGRYSIGAPLGRLDAQGVEVRVMQQAVTIHPDGADLRHIYSKRTERADGFDSVVLACGGISDAGLHSDLTGRHPDLHLLGDAFAPRRLVFATRQAHALALILAKE